MNENLRLKQGKTHESSRVIDLEKAMIEQGKTDTNQIMKLADQNDQLI